MAVNYFGDEVDDELYNKVIKPRGNAHTLLWWLMKGKDITVRELAEASGLNHNTITSVLKKRRKPEVLSLVMIAEAIGWNGKPKDLQIELDVYELGCIEELEAKGKGKSYHERR